VVLGCASGRIEVWETRTGAFKVKGIHPFGHQSGINVAFSK
jgi:hypothetical protein